MLSLPDFFILVESFNIHGHEMFLKPSLHERRDLEGVYPVFPTPALL
jgi:hypothetical protein